MTDVQATIVERMRKIIPHIKHCSVLGIDVISADVGKIKLILPYNDHIIGNVDTGTVSGGTLTSLMDTACGFAGVAALSKPSLMPTLDLRIDYMSTGEPGLDIMGEAEAYRVTNNVVFCRGIAYHEGQQDNPIAHCTATFMRLDPKLASGAFAKRDKPAEAD
jgi:uncharacterized protein (TIGR00369 family)